MNVKQRAIVQTIGILAAIVGGSVAVTLILERLTTEQIVNGFAIISIALLVYSMYGVILSRLQYEETLKKIVDERRV